jgi:aspartate-semialdehyde dehydrogenase
MKKVGLVGWRGMVGSVLVRRMLDEGDFKCITPYFFGTTSAGSAAPIVDDTPRRVLDARSVNHLGEMDIIVSCQGGDYTTDIYPLMRAAGWQGYWIDAASTRRMEPDSVIVLDPLNRAQIEAALDQGIKNFIGGNCSITLTLLGLAGLFRAGLVEGMTVMTYQAVSGAGAASVRELVAQMGVLYHAVESELADPSSSILDIDSRIGAALRSPDFPHAAFGVPLAGNIIPWIDSDLENGVSREEWKGEVETNKILGLEPGAIRVDGLCVRVGTLRSHAAAVTLHLKEKATLEVLESLIRDSHQWVDLVPNTKADTLARLTPVAVNGSLKVAVGRLRKMSVGDTCFSVMTVGDQLLWGAAEPLRRMLGILLVYGLSNA